MLFALVNPTLRSFVASSALRPGSLQPVLRALFAAGNWNLLWTLLAVVVVLGWRRWWRTPRAWLLAMIAAPALLYLYVLLGTAAARFALLSTADSRLFLTLSPLVLVFVFDLAAALTCHDRRSTTIRTIAAPG